MHAIYAVTVNSTAMHSDDITWLQWVLPVVQHQQTGYHEVHLNCMETNEETGSN